jgi:uncharacterized damage-inducible protein DinB
MEWFEREFKFGLPIGMLPFYMERLEGTCARIQAKVKNVPEEMLSYKLNGKWSVKENIGHLADVDEIAMKRIGEIISSISPMSSAVIQPQKEYNKQAILKVIEHFMENRTSNLNAYRALDANELEKKSVHPRLKVSMTPVDLAWFDAEHDDHHLVRIGEIISVLLPKTN